MSAAGEWGQCAWRSVKPPHLKILNGLKLIADRSEPAYAYTLEKPLQTHFPFGHFFILKGNLS